MAQAGTLIPAALALHMQIAARGIPVMGVAGPPWTVTYDPAATTEQIAEGDALAASFDGADRVYRNLFAIYADIAALALVQKGRIWANLGGGGDKLYYHDEGPQAPVIATLDLLIWSASLAQTAVDEAKLRLMAVYVSDYPYYLAQPVFDPTINILGLEVV